MILGIESSCDESALALLDVSNGILGEWISSQVSLHAEYGGVVPDLASREHLRNFGPLLSELERENDLAQITEIVVTSGPGLAGCLAMGLSVANALSTALRVPVFPANHLRAHAQSVFISLYEENVDAFEEKVSHLLPHLSLVVSGGNTILAQINEDRSIEILGQTIDDAAGEALDKGAKLLGLGYPGGPKLELIAKTGKPDRYDFPRALLRKDNLAFSFSGLKTSLRYLIEKFSDKDLEAKLPDLCASYQEAVVDVLIQKTKWGLNKGGIRSLGLSGGVSNNVLLRECFMHLGDRMDLPTFLARREHTGDNAGMIAFSRVFEPMGIPNSKVDIVPNAAIDGVF